MFRKIFIYFGLIFTTLLGSCTLPDRNTSLSVLDQEILKTSVAATLTSIWVPSNTPTSEIQLVASTNTPTPYDLNTSTPTPSITPTFSNPSVYFDSNVNCRLGPGTEYGVLILIKEGSRADVVGASGNYWIVQPPNRTDTCWVPAEFVTPEGSYWVVTTITPPPSPTPVPPPRPGWKKWYYSCSYENGGTVLTMEMEWIDKSTNEEGFKVMRDGDVIAEFPADSTSFIDKISIGTGQKFEYKIQSFIGSSFSDSSIVTASCDD